MGTRTQVVRGCFNDLPIAGGSAVSSVVAIFHSSQQGILETSPAALQGNMP